jgi:hypothetical protein
MKGILRVPDEGDSIPFIGYSQNPLHQVLLESPSSGTLRIPFIGYSQNPPHQVLEYLMKGILRVPDEGDSEST